MSRWVSPSSFVASAWFPSAVQRHEHLPPLVLPAQGGVGVIAVLFDAFFELAAGVVSDLQIFTVV